MVARLPRTTRKILIHINNTNPVLTTTAPSTRAPARGWHRACLRRHGLQSMKVAEMINMMAPWNHVQFEAQLRERGKAYHIHHRLTSSLNAGKATPEQIRGWVANRYYYPDRDTDQGRGDPRQLSRARVRRQWVSASSIMTATATVRRHRGLASTRAGRRPDARRTRRPAPRAARRALRRRCVRELRPPRPVAGGRMRVADRTCSRRRSTRNGWRRGPNTIRGSTRPASSTSAIA